MVLANPKTILHAKYAKKEIKQKVIRADQLVKHIKDICEQSKELESSEKQTLQWARSFKALHKDVEKDYTSKYKKYKIGGSTIEKSHDLSNVEDVTPSAPIPVEQTDIYKELKAYRLKKSHEEDIKPYFIYNNNQLKDLISKMPRTKVQLLSVQGIAEAKVNKYGDDIIAIVSKY